MTTKPTGGFRRPVQLSTWIRDQLADGRETHAYALYGDYVTLMKELPLARKRGRRSLIKPESFRNYLYILRRLGLIQYVIDPSTGKPREEMALDKGGNPAPQMAMRLYIRANMARIGDPAWEQIWDAYEAMR